MREELLEDFAVKGLLPPKAVASWRALEPRIVVPRPKPDEVVSFLTFHKRRLGYPAHWFLRKLLCAWGLELQHLNLNGVLHVTGFVTICETFLGMELHVDLFRGIFNGWALS